MSKQYVSGYNAEIEIRNKLRKEGYFVVRSAGSKSCIDLIAINKDGIILIQSKKFSKKSKVKDWRNVKDIKEDIKRIEQLEVPINCIKQLWIKWKGEWETFNIK